MEGNIALRVDLYWQQDILVSVRASGHAPAQHKELCTSVSCLLRSSAQALEALSVCGLENWELKLPAEGQFSWVIHKWPITLLGPLQGVSLVLSCGLRRLADEYSVWELCEHFEKPCSRNKNIETLL